MDSRLFYLIQTTSTLTKCLQNAIRHSPSLPLNLLNFLKASKNVKDRLSRALPAAEERAAVAQVLLGPEGPALMLLCDCLPVVYYELLEFLSFLPCRGRTSGEGRGELVNVLTIARSGERSEPGRGGGS